MPRKIPLGGKVTEVIYSGGSIRYNVVTTRGKVRTVLAARRTIENHYGKR